MLCIVGIIDCTHMLFKISKHIIPCDIVDIVTAPFEVQSLDNIAQANPTSDILIDYQLRPPLDMATVDQYQELHKPNS